MASFLSQNSLHTFLKCSNIPCTQPSKPLRQYTVTYASLHARDKIIDFGKYKGRMLGTLPSTYLKWVSNNLRARDFEEWANLADQVLEDPIYKDRIEWEFAQKVLNGDVLNINSKAEGGVVELLEISQRFGWDNEDKVAWSKVDFQLLGTSKGGRIPRVKDKRGEELRNSRIRGAEDGAGHRGESSGTSVGERVGARGRRVERRDRVKMKREMPKFERSNRFDNAVKDEEEDEGSKHRKSKESLDHNAGVYNPFPGRETLLRKALNRRRIN